MVLEEAAGLGQRFLGLEEEETKGSGMDRPWKSSPGAQGGEALVGKSRN